MASERAYFDLSGPLHLTSVDWNNPYHRRSVAASLVQGVYMLERDRQQQRQGSDGLAPPWWLFFQFELIQPLKDNVDSSIIGAVYKYNGPCKDSPNTPAHVVAFRGTVTKKESISQDIRLDLQILNNRLHQTCRVEVGMQAVRNLVAASMGLPRVWLAGHSLGSAIAMIIGKKMAKTGIFLESFLFNPPCLGAPIERIKNPKLKIGLRFASSLVTAGVAVAVKGPKSINQSENPLAALAAWVPNLFVNQADHICSEYIGYFQHRNLMQQIGARGIEKLAGQHTLGSLLLNMKGGGQEMEPLHAVPSANLIVNSSTSNDFKAAHGIHQWWRPDLQLQFTEYRYS